MSIQSITKDGSIMVISLNERDNPVKVDCRDFSVISFTGRTVKRLPSMVTENLYNQPYGIREVVAILKGIKNSNVGDCDYSRYVELFKQIEPFLTVLELLDSVPESCPKGFIKFVMDNDLRISRNSLNLFLAEKSIKNMSESDKETLKIIREHYTSTNSRYIEITKLPIEKLKVFLKLFRNTMKSFSWNVDSDITAFLNITEKTPKFKDNWTELVDMNRDFAKNTELLVKLRDKEKEDKIILTENRIREITKIETENYCIVVPENLEDFTNEGKQQNNCVGYYYHDSIMDGENAVYFIRKKSSPEKSNTTCRFRFAMCRTVEYRVVNNGEVKNAEILDLISRVDNFLSGLFS